MKRCSLSYLISLILFFSLLTFGCSVENESEKTFNEKELKVEIQDMSRDNSELDKLRKAQKRMHERLEQFKNNPHYQQKTDVEEQVDDRREKIEKALEELLEDAKRIEELIKAEHEKLKNDN